MDKGAHFKKCDFQVHTPRDNQWTGIRLGVTDDQIQNLTAELRGELDRARIQFAKEYLQKVRSSGINAIAITDHHDVVFAKIIRNVANEENQAFIAAGESKNCITVFPGIELTLVTPTCQCLLIFDNTITNQELDNALGMFGIAPSNDYHRETAPVTRITNEQITDLQHLHRKLDSSPGLKGKYILLPNLNNGGTSTLLRAGAHDHYKKMPCVGGYVDKNIPTNDSGWTNKLNGGDVNYGNKSVGLISTSDNRFEDGREFGKYFTWIKWAEPTSEALRQAFLAKQSRISQTEPQLPQIFITKIEITNSKFLGAFDLEFNRQYNALIGGRGTGKSTVLEYLRWGLCDQTVSIIELEALNELDKRRKKLIENTLGDFEGEVMITFMLNSSVHIVKRNSKTKETFLKIDDNEFQTVSEEQIRNILRIQAYSQKQLSGVGVSTGELKRFIEAPIAPELANYDFYLAEITKETRSAYLNVRRKQEVENENEQLVLEITSLETQVENLRNSLAGITPEQQEVISKKSTYDSELSFVTKVNNEIRLITDGLSTFEQQLETYPQPLNSEIQLENPELINGIDRIRTERINGVKSLVLTIKNLLSNEQDSSLADIIQQWEAAKNVFDAEYEAAKSSTSSNQQQLTEIQRIETRLTQLRNNLIARNATLLELGAPEQIFNDQREAYWELHRNRLAMLTEQARNFTALSKDVIKVEVEKNLDTVIIKAELAKLFALTRINQDKIQAVADHIALAEDPIVEWKSVLDELRSLAELNKQAEALTNQIPDCPKLRSFGLNDGNISKIAENLSVDTWLNASTIKIEFTPDFKYTTNIETGDTISFSEASAGQQATALLTVLLSQPGAPLIIDQPEDDIDNKATEEIIKNIWDAKKHRQIIFTSHNANLVVNGDAELVVCFDYRDAGSQTYGMKKAEGAIDSKEVKKEITMVMEGGEKAFKLRKDKYGY